MELSSEVQEARRRRLRQLVHEHEGMNALARRLGMGRGAYISQLLKEPPLRPITEKTARRFEKELNKPAGWMDGVDPQAPQPIKQELLSAIIAQVIEALEVAKINLPAPRLADLISMIYADAVTAGGKVDSARLSALVRLIKR